MHRRAPRRPGSWALAAGAVIAGVLATLPVPAATAAYVTRSTSTASVTAAADWTPPTVTLRSPGAAVKGTVALEVDAADAETGIAQVVVEVLAPGASEWVVLCTDTTAPHGCSWNTSSLAEGQYALRARALDRSGYETTSAVVRTTVANKLMVVLDSPGDAVRGTVALRTDVFNVGTVAHTVRVEYRLADTTTWRSLCTGLVSPYTCSWNTTAFAAGEYDLRAVLVAGSTTTVSEVVEEVEVDNTAPTVAFTDPGTPLSGPVTFAATAADSGSGVETVVLQAAPAGTSTWRTLCTVDAEPFSCRLDTAQLADGGWQFRAVATDAAGNSTTSAVVGPRTVDNTIASVVVDAPASFTGTVSVGATATSSAGVASVRLQYSVAGKNAWVDLCTDTTAPYACQWNTASVADGSYDLRAVMTDRAGRVTTSAIDAANRVDNSPLRGVDVQTSNGGSTAGKPDAGDTLTFTYSAQVNPASVVSGWNGAARSVTVRFRDGVLLGRSGREDGLDVLSGSTVLPLGSVNLKGDQVKSLRTASLSATMTHSTTTTSDGVVRSVITLRLGATSSRLRTLSTTSQMVWSPASGVTDLQGRSCSTAVVTETGTSDREF